MFNLNLSFLSTHMMLFRRVMLPLLPVLTVESVVVWTSNTTPLSSSPSQSPSLTHLSATITSEITHNTFPITHPESPTK
ncbi:hypothetical protein BDQ17DRAFT_1373033 [Cyathus striatus]|nr:hypothetical protein BDQ17DRAFT_1373033 [Cyathus striatus]